jgi:predicted alpha/beta-fold hydrolase
MLKELVRSVESDPFCPLPGLASAHAQTLLGASLPRRALSSAHAWYVDSEPGTRVLCQAHVLHARGEGTTLLVVHGLAGSAASGHVLDVTRKALAAGLSVVRFNMRNCSATEHLTRTLYHANLVQDLRAAILEVLERLAPRQLVLAGYSVGANLIVNTLASFGTAPPAELRGAVLLCPALDLSPCVARVDAPDNALYRRHFVKELSALAARRAKLQPARRAPSQRIRTLRDFDRLLTAPEAGFDDVEAFYAWVSAGPRLAQVNVPCLLLRSTDDPVIELLPETRAAIARHPRLAMVEVPRGGHCGFRELPSRLRPDGLWAVHHVVRAALAFAS